MPPRPVPARDPCQPGRMPLRGIPAARGLINSGQQSLAASRTGQRLIAVRFAGREAAAAENYNSPLSRHVWGVRWQDPDTQRLNWSQRWQEVGREESSGCWPLFGGKQPCSSLEPVESRAGRGRLGRVVPRCSPRAGISPTAPTLPTGSQLCWSHRATGGPSVRAQHAACKRAAPRWTDLFGDGPSRADSPRETARELARPRSA